MSDRELTPSFYHALQNVPAMLAIEQFLVLMGLAKSPPRAHRNQNRPIRRRPIQILQLGYIQRIRQNEIRVCPCLCGLGASSDESLTRFRAKVLRKGLVDDEVDVFEDWVRSIVVLGCVARHVCFGCSCDALEEGGEMKAWWPVRLRIETRWVGGT